MRKDRTWTGWRRVERGAKLGGGLIVDGGEPLDVAAVAYQNRIYIASRWTPVRIQLAEEEIIAVNVIAVNFTEDGDNWSGWRIPPNDRPDGIVEQYAGRAAGTTVALAGLGNHLYIFARDQSTSVVRVY